MKLKDIKGLLPNCFPKTYELIPKNKNKAYNLGQTDYKKDVGEKEFEFDVDKIISIIKTVQLKDFILGDGRRSKTRIKSETRQRITQAISKADIIKVKEQTR